MRDAYHDELEGLTDSLVEMTRLVGGAIGRSTQALIDADVSLADQVIAHDEAVDDLREDVERRAFDLLARQQPVASDLRTIITTMRIVVDLERAGDLAQHVAKVARRRYPASAIPPSLRATVLEMGQVAQRIVAKTGTIIATRDVVAARELEQDDDVMDELHSHLYRSLLDSEWRGEIEEAVDVVLVGRYYERFADHAVLVARSVVYLVTGEPVTSHA